jgi:hypothetical protein
MTQQSVPMSIVPGRFKGRAISAALGYTSTGTEQVGVLMLVTEGDYAGFQETWYGYFSEKALPVCMRALRAMGFQGEDLTLVEQEGALPSECVLVFQNELDQQGAPRVKLAFINALGAGGQVAIQNRMNPEQAKGFAANLKARILALQPGQPTPPAPAPNTAPGTKAPF